jgi:hypothetical protein
MKTRRIQSSSSVGLVLSRIAITLAFSFFCSSNIRKTAASCSSLNASNFILFGLAIFLKICLLFVQFMLIASSLTQHSRSNLGRIIRMGPVTDIQDLINEHGSSSTLRARLALLKDQISNLMKERGDLQQKLADLHVENTYFRKQLEAKTIAAEFTGHRGALFKRKPSGGYYDTVYCPSCRFAMSSLGDVLFYTCHKCRITLDFCGHDLPSVLTELMS